MLRPRRSYLRVYFEKEYWPRKTKGRSEANRRLYIISIRNLAKFLGRAPTLADLDDEIFSRWLIWFMDRGRSSETANQNCSNLLALWRFAARRRHIGIFPTVELLPEVRRMPLAWTEPELRMLFESARKQPGYVGNVAAGAWWTALLLVLWYTGERISAALSLRWDDYNSTTGWVIFRAETRKGKTHDNPKRLPAHASVALSRIRNGSDRIFHWDRSFQSLFDHMEAILKRAGLPSGRRDKFHRVRRSTASHLKRLGGDAREALGHGKEETTNRFYIDPRIASGPGPGDILFDPTSDS